jgi:polyhydroxybutyrate depolymerase
MARTLKAMILTAALAAAVAGAPRPALAGPPAPGTWPQAILSGGLVRNYILYIPSGYTGEALPVVFVLHGFGGSAAAMVASTNLNAKADAEGFFVAYLQGTPCDPNPPYAAPNCTGTELGWNTGITDQLGILTNDVQFVRDVLVKVEATVVVDRVRVYAAGFSNGAMMAHRLGAEMPRTLAAIAAVEGTVGIYQPSGTLLTTPTPVGPIPAIIVHGLLDAVLPYAGGPGAGGASVLSASDAVDFWRNANGCTTGPFTSTSPGGNVVKDVYGGCVAGSNVVLVSIGNGAHFWPTPANTGFSATNAIWTFFENHPLN